MSDPANAEGLGPVLDLPPVRKSPLQPPPLQREDPIAKPLVYFDTLQIIMAFMQSEPVRWKEGRGPLTKAYWTRKLCDLDAQS